MANTIINANGTLIIKGNAVVDATGALKVPEGNTAQRPSLGANGYIRYNTTSDSFEGYTSAGWGAIGGGGGSTGTVTSVDSGSGLTGGPITGSGTLAVGAGDGITVNPNNVAINTSWLSGYIGTVSGSGTVTSVASGAGLSGGPITTTGTLVVGAGDGITVNADNVALASTTAGNGLTYTTGVLDVVAGDGITVNTNNVAVNVTWLTGFIGIVSGSGTVTSVDSGSGLTGGPITGSGTLAVGAGDGITVNPNNVAINTSWLSGYIGTAASGGTGTVTSVASGAGLSGGPITSTGTLAVGAGDGITVNADNVALASTTAGNGLTYTTGVLDVVAGDGITVNPNNVAVNVTWLSGYIGTVSGSGTVTSVASGAGLTGGPITGSGTLAVGAGDGITVNADNVALASTTAGSGLTYTTGVLAVGAGDGITVNPNNVAINTTWLSGYIGTAATGGTGTVTSVASGAGLTGGPITATGTLAVGAGDGITVNADNVAVDSTVVRTTGDQSIAGVKTFTSNTTMSNVTVNGYVTTPLKVNNQGVASEGGQIELRKPSSGSLLSGDLAIDLFGNTIRIFDNASTFRGMYANIAACAPGPASEIVHSTNYSIFFDQELSGAAGAGLTYTTGNLNVGAGDGITVNANDVAVSTSWLDGYLGTAAGKNITGGRVVLGGGAAGLTSDAGLTYNTGTDILTVTGAINASGDVTAFATSDRRLKENIMPIDHALDKLSQINGVMFDWTDTYMQQRGGEDGYFQRRHDTGVIAQEVEQVLPEAVATRDSGYLAVRYEKLVPLLIQAVKELHTQNIAGVKPFTGNKIFSDNLSTSGSYNGGITTSTIECGLGNCFNVLVNTNTKFLFSNVPTVSYSFTLEVAHTYGIITWPANVIWPNNAAPGLRIGKPHIFVFFTRDNGINWHGTSLNNYTP